jgi:hypothetical protein
MSHHDDDIASGDYLREDEATAPVAEEDNELLKKVDPDDSDEVAGQAAD